MIKKSYKSIKEVSNLLDIKQHVIRYWDFHFEGISTRLGEKKRRYFSQENIKKLITLKEMLHTNGKSHHSLELAKRILEKGIKTNSIIGSVNKFNNVIDIDKLSNISKSLKQLL